MARDIAASKLTKNQAMKLCEEIRAGMGSIAQKLYDLHHGCGWTVLGYLTWKECIEQEFQHSAWWANNQVRIAEVRKALPPLPPKYPPKQVEGLSPAREHPSTHNGEEISDSAALELAKVPEENRIEVFARAVEESDGKAPTAATIRAASKPDRGKCPNCLGTKWTEEDGSVACAKCHHPYGEPAGDVDEDRVKTQRSKTIKTIEALMRAFDDLQALCPNSEHGDAISVCKQLLKTARGWK